MIQRSPEKLHDILRGVLLNRGYLSACREAQVEQKWVQIVGARVAGVTESLDIRDGVLYIRVSSSAWRQEVSFLKRQILDNIRKHTECDTITDIVFC